MDCDKPVQTGAEHGIDEQAAISDWAQLDGVLAHFPNPDYPGLFQSNPPPDGRYRIAHWWHGLFEGHWGRF